MIVQVFIAIALTRAPVSVTQQDPPAHKAAMDHRGHLAMGFDQAKISHTFSTAERGGKIEIVAKDANDSETVAQIRSHLREIAKLFKAGDFSKPVFIHAQNPPGADTMKARRADIEYRFEEIASGGRLTATSANVEAITAIHTFLRFQQREHK